MTVRALWVQRVAPVVLATPKLSSIISERSHPGVTDTAVAPRVPPYLCGDPIPVTYEVVIIVSAPVFGRRSMMSPSAGCR
jgi:hypothetical protein